MGRNRVVVDLETGKNYRWRGVVERALGQTNVVRSQVPPIKMRNSVVSMRI